MAALLASWRLCIIITAFCHALFGFGEVQSECNEDQSSLLLQLRSSLLFDSSVSTKLAEWNSDTDCCSWPGVACGASGQYVTALDLSNENIEGGFNDSSPLFELRSLTNLNLAQNLFPDTSIPSELGKLTGLMRLNLSDAGFYGQVPIELSSLLGLATLDLSSENSGLVVENPNLHMLIGNLSELVELRLDQVNMSTQSDSWGEVLSSSTPKLEVLSLSGCGLSGHIQASLQNLTSLSLIDLSGNYLSGLVPQFFSNFKNLTSMSLGTNLLSGNFPSKILQLPSLKSIDLSVNVQLKGSLPIFSQNNSLETLTISGTMFSGTIPKSIGDLKMLSYLDLSSSNFTGPLPDSIAKLTRLVHVDLSKNSFSSRIPSFSRSKQLSILYLGDNQLTGTLLSTNWNELSQLKELMLSNNSLSGSIPMSLFGISSLDLVSLHHNEFTGFTEEIVNTSFSRLTGLDLYNNNIEGSIPAFIYNGLKRLWSLDLSFNSFGGKLHIRSLHQLKELQYFDLSHNNLAVEFGDNDFLPFPSLKHLGLASCQLNAFPSRIKTLMYIDLSDNQIFGEVPSWIWNLDNDFSGLQSLTLNFSHNSLQKLNMPRNLSRSYYSLDVSHNLFDGEQLPSILPSVQYLDLSNNRFSGTVPSMVGYFNKLFFLSLSSNNLTGAIPEWICNSTELLILDLSDNFLSASIPPCLMDMSKLRVVNFMRNNITGIIPDSFASDCTMNTLNLDGNILEGTIPKSLSRCTSLQVLDLGNNELHDTFPCWMRMSLPSLSVLVLRSNLLHGMVQCSSIRGFVDWTRLQILDLSSNNFSGNLPSQELLAWKAMQVDRESRPHTDRLQYQSGRFLYVNTVSVTGKNTELNLTSILTIFSAIDFSDNKFEGNIPYEFGHLNAILVLNVSGNRLTGGIPKSLGELINLESLDLSRNELTGPIPAELGDLTFLAVLNVSFNQLEGPIPKGSQMQNFLEDSFEGNEALCGSPLKKMCGAKGTPTSLSQVDASQPLTGIRVEVFVAIQVGYAVGLGLAVMPLIFWPRWRMGFDEFTDSILTNIFCINGRPEKADLV